MKASDEAVSQYVAAYKKISDARKKGTKDEGRTGGGTDPFEKIRKDVNALSGYYKKANADQKTFIKMLQSRKISPTKRLIVLTAFLLRLKTRQKALTSFQK